MKFERVCLGGTFDPPIHKGHEALIRKAFERGKFVIIGLTSDRYFYYMGKDIGFVRPFQYRKNRLTTFLNLKGYTRRYEIVPIDGDYDERLVKEKGYCEAIIVSPETFRTAMEINRERGEKGLPELEIIQVKTVLASDGIPISSTRIRKGEIDSKGNVIRNKSSSNSS